MDLGSWNASHSRRWNLFRTRLRQQYPGLQFFRGVEVQGRGALHDHALVWSPEPLDAAWCRSVAMDAGFGHASAAGPGLKVLVPGSSAAAHYVSKYVTKAADVRSDVPWTAQVVDTSTGELSLALVPGRYRTWSSSRQWGEAMSVVRARNADLARRLAQQRKDAQEAGVWDVLTSILGPLTVLDPPPPD